VPDIPDLTDVASLVDSVLNTMGVAHVFIGGFAVILRGFDRPTTDIDGVMWDVDDRLEKIVGAFQEAGFRTAHSTPIEFARRNRV